MRYLFILLLPVFVLGAPLPAQGQDDYAAPFGAFFTNDADVGLVAIMPTGETMGVLTETDEGSHEITGIRGAVWQTPEGTLTVLLNDEGLPESMVMDGVTLLFDNYTDSAATITVVPDEGEAVELTNQELNPEALAILRGFASLTDEVASAPTKPAYAKRLAQRSAREIALRSVAVVAHVGGAMVSSASCAGLALATITTIEIGIGTLLAGATGLACAGAANTVATLPDSVSALWNAAFDPNENLARLQETDAGYISTSDSIIIDVVTTTDPTSTVTSIGLTIISASASEWADAELRLEAARLALDAIRRQQQSGLATGDVSGVFDTSYGAMTFGGGRAPYTSDNGRILYELQGRTLIGYWVEDSSAQNCGSARDGSNYWGRVIFTFNEDFSEFEGLWSYCEAEPTDGWYGTRQAE